MAKLARGVRAKWISFDQENWTLIGKNMESLENTLNPDIENSKDVTGASYTEHKGFAPEADIEYKCNDSDSIYDKLQEIVDTLAKDETSTAATMIDATLNDEVKNGTTATLTGKGYKVPVLIVPQSEGGDTGAYVINFNAYENGARIQGTVSVSNGVPTFTAAS